VLQGVAVLQLRSSMPWHSEQILPQCVAALRCRVLQGVAVCVKMRDILMN